jgi:hypothetical protein
VLIGLLRGFAVAKEKLFPSQENAPDDERAPHDRFSDLASKVVTVPKSEIDKREKKWKRSREK